MGRKLAFVLASSKHGTMIVNRFDYRMVNAEQGFGVGFQILETGVFDPDEVSMALQILNMRRRHYGNASGDACRYFRILGGRRLRRVCSGGEDGRRAGWLGPLVAPRGSPWGARAAEMPEPVQALRGSLSARPAWAWVLARYEHDRRAPVTAR